MLFRSAAINCYPDVTIHSQSDSSSEASLKGEDLCYNSCSLTIPLSHSLVSDCSGGNVRIRYVFQVWHAHLARHTCHLSSRFLSLPLRLLSPVWICLNFWRPPQSQLNPPEGEPTPDLQTFWPTLLRRRHYQLDQTSWRPPTALTIALPQHSTPVGRPTVATGWARRLPIRITLHRGSPAGTGWPARHSSVSTLTLTDRKSVV